jgi:hypothetical protein
MRHAAATQEHSNSLKTEDLLLPCCCAGNASLPVNLTKGYRDQRISAWGNVEASMTELFSVTFTAIFVVFGVAAVIGHALLAEALVRPFFGKLDVRKQPVTSALLAS